MVHSHRRRLVWSTLLILICAGAGLCFGCTRPATWEARATVAVYSPQALSALPGVIGSEFFFGQALSAQAIPGTCLMTLTAASTAPEDTSRILSDALNRIPTALSWLGIPADTEVVRSGTRLLQSPDPLKFCLTGGLLGLAAALILLIPPAEPREPLSLWAVLRRIPRLARRFRLLILAAVLLWAWGNFLHTNAMPPVCRSETLVRFGNCEPESAAGVSAAVRGLIASNLIDGSLEAVPLGNSNLFLLSCTASSPEEAQAGLLTLFDRWPGLLDYTTLDLTLTVLQSPSLPPPYQKPSPVPALAAGSAWGAALCLALLFLLSMRQEGKYANN